MTVWRVCGVHFKGSGDRAVRRVSLSETVPITISREGRTGDLWAGVEQKISNARFFLGDMGQSLRRDHRAEARAIAAGVYMPVRWEESFYARLDALLVMARSVPEVINCWSPS